MPPPDSGYSLYLHVPFCQVRCAYCDFNTYAGLESLIPAYTRALVREIQLVGAAAGGPPAHTVFFGGGTPSLLPASAVGQILQAVRDSFALDPAAEITLEANPGTVSRAQLEGLRALGVNRLSFGVQSSHPHELRLLDRLHLFGDAAQAVTWARQAGFDNLNLDLIFGLPHQTLELWQATLERTLGLGPEHLSAYALSLEHGTPMRAWVQRGLLPSPDPDLAADMYELASQMLERHGYAQYEISNWARIEPGGRRSEVRDSYLRPLTSDLQCRHNLQYWRNRPYLGFGAGAHGYAAGRRYANVLSPQAYVERLEAGGAREFPLSPAVAEITTVTRQDELGETMMLGLRLTGEGVRAADFQARFGVSLEAHYGERLRRLQARGLIEWDARGVRLTRPGRLLGNQVFMEFV